VPRDEDESRRKVLIFSHTWLSRPTPSFTSCAPKLQLTGVSAPYACRTATAGHIRVDLSSSSPIRT